VWRADKLHSCTSCSTEVAQDLVVTRHRACWHTHNDAAEVGLQDVLLDRPLGTEVGSCAYARVPACIHGCILFSGVIEGVHVWL